MRCSLELMRSLLKFNPNKMSENLRDKEAEIRWIQTFDQFIDPEDPQEPDLINHAVPTASMDLY
jgi:hypothetical protein